MTNIWIAGVAESLSIACAAHMWLRSRRSVGWKIVWTPLVLVPVVGPLIYGGMYDPPGVQPDALQAEESDLDAESSFDPDP